MRDSIIGLLLITFTAVGYLAFQRADLRSSATSTVAQPSTSNFNAPKGAHKHEAATKRNSDKAWSEREDEGDSDDLEQDQRITSIYQEEGPQQHSSESALNNNQGKKKVIHGVPIQPWIASRRNAIPLSEEAPEEERLLKVYLQCVELKKGGPQYVGKHECERLFARPANGV